MSLEEDQLLEGITDDIPNTEDGDDAASNTIANPASSNFTPTGSKGAEQQKDVHRRQVLGSVYTGVRSRAQNVAIASYTFDHYIEEAKRAIKGDDLQLRDAAGKVVDIRPTKLKALDTLQREFTKVIADLKEAKKTKS